MSHDARSRARTATIRLAAAVFCVLFARGGLAAEAGGILAEETPWATPYYISDSGQPGPTVMIVGGMHGNEPAGAYAAEQIRHWPIVRGKLIVVPRANVQALAANKRLTPGAEAKISNLNRNFAAAAKGDDPPRGVMAEALWTLIKSERPMWLLDLHEGYDFNGINANSVGSTVIVHPSPDADEAASLMLAAVNAKIDDEQKKFRRRSPPIDTSLARAVGEHLDIRSMILETTSKSQPLSHRARQHRLMVHCFFDHLNMLAAAVTPDWVAPRDDWQGRMRVALYDAGGSSGAGVPRVLEQLSSQPDVGVVRVGPDDIRGGALKQFDVVIFTGGSGSKQAAALSDEGRKQVHQFVSEGGGYLGICAGSYLACEGFSWGLKVLDAKTVSSKWQRGRGMTRVELTSRGREIFGEPGAELLIKYHNGPIWMPAASDLLADYEPLAVFRSELAENGTPEGAMVGSPAIVAGECGQGRVLCISPHPEQTEGLEHFVPRAVKWIANKKAAPQAAEQ
jgi:phosphoribosylformylglycinamidine (FGAM) synthase-like amidotransferase family enzyme